MAWREWVAIYLKGAFMGAADTVPGVSGGTIALITGIYERLVDAIAGLDPRVIEHVVWLHTAEGRAQLYADLREMDLPFLVVLGAGIATSVVTLSSVMHRAVESEQFAPPTFAFFFGLIAASAVVLYRYVEVDTSGRIAASVVGFVLAVVVSGASEGGGTVSPSLAFVFLAGSVAITAMILPGISGAFILLLLGLYGFMVEIPEKTIEAVFMAIQNGNPAALAGPGVPLVTFLAGAVVGLLTVAHVVRWALDHYREATLAFLVALMLGALRAPAEQIQNRVEVWTPGFAVGVIAAALVGAGLVLGLDHFTDDLEY